MTAENQLTLPTIEPPPFAPIWPKPNNLSALALQLFLEGKRLDHPTFMSLSGSWRLAAVVNILKKLGWPIAVTNIPAPSDSCAYREIGLYHLPSNYAAMALTMRGGRP